MLVKILPDTSGQYRKGSVVAVTSIDLTSQKLREHQKLRLLSSRDETRTQARTRGGAGHAGIHDVGQHEKPVQQPKEP